VGEQESIMRTLLLGMLILGSLATLGSRAPAGEREVALELIEQAIKAHGGADKLTRLASHRRAGSGTMTQIGREIPFTTEVVTLLPDRLRLVIELDKRFQLTTVMDGDKGWQQSAGGSTVELTRERLQEIREEAYLWWLTTLVPLQQDGFTLTTVADVTIDGAAAAGVKIHRKGHLDARFYFDKQSGLLVKIERRAPEAGITVDKEYFYSQFKEFDGVKLPTKEVMTINGKKWSEVSGMAYQLLPRIEDKMFARP
jgi:hypothetical protein